MRRLLWKRIVALGLMVIMIVIGGSTGDTILKSSPVYAKQESISNSVNMDASALKVSVDFFDYNLKKYKGEDVDKNTKIALNAYALEKITSGSSINANQVFLFGGERKGGQTGLHNVWTGRGKAQYQGIVKSELDKDGKLQFNEAAGIYGVNLFPEQGDHSMDDVIKPYYNANFQFLDDNGTFIFDSGRFAAYNLKKISETESSIKIDMTQKGPLFSNKTGTFGNKYGFFPFNTASENDLKAKEARHHMFGMKMELDFYMPEDGRIVTEDETKEEDMVFKFSGDDDVWVFIDGKLALDLGGIHDTVGGEINFATGDITYERETTGGTPTQVKNIYTAYPEIKRDTLSEHKLTMFYLERGEYDSNCKITFNIPTIIENEDISIKKKVVNAPKDNTDTYHFALYTGEEKNNVNKVYKGTYKVYDKQNVFREKRTATDGIITLNAEETAVVNRTKVALGQYYKVKEIIDEKRYTAEWFSTGDDSNAASGKGTQTDILVRDSEHPKGSHIEFTNTYLTYTSLSLKKVVDSSKYNGDPFLFIVSIGEKEYNVVLKDGEERIFEQIPCGTAFKITEVLTPGSIYTTPDAVIDGQQISVKTETVSGYAITGKLEESLKEGYVKKVIYTNHGKKETPTPEVTPTPIVSETPEITGTPEVSETPESTQTPTITPMVIVTPKPTETLEITETPNVLNTPEPTKTPQMTNTPEPTKTPTVLETPKSTEMPKSTETPEITGTPNVPNTSEPTQTPVRTEAPEITVTPTSTAPTIDIPEDTEIPGASPVPLPTDVEKPENTSLPEDIIPGDNIPNNPPEVVPTKKPTEKKDTSKEDETIIVEDIPSHLPQTGGIGEKIESAKKRMWIFLLPVVVCIGGILYLWGTKKNRKKKEGKES